MKILEKHILKNFIIAFAFCITLLMVLGVIGDILGFLDDIFKKGIPLSSIFLFYLYFAPFAFVNMVPFACLLGAVFVFNDLSKNHEVTAIITSGISLWKVMKPVLLATFVLCLCTFIVNEKLVPGAMGKAGQIRQEKLERSGEEGKQVVENLTAYGEGNQMIFAREYYPETKKMEDVIIHKLDTDQATTKKINAKSAKWRDDGFWVGTDVIVFNLDSNGDFAWDPEVYKNKKLPIRESPGDFVNTQLDPKMMSYDQLKRYISILAVSSSPTSVRRLAVDLNYKLVFPFTAMITVLVGIPFSIATGRVNALLGMARGIFVAMLYLPVMAVCLAFGKRGILPPVLSVWLSIILFTFLGAYFVNKRS